MSSILVYVGAKEICSGLYIVFGTNFGRTTASFIHLISSKNLHQSVDAFPLFSTKNSVTVEVYASLLPL